MTTILAMAAAALLGAGDVEVKFVGSGAMTRIGGRSEEHTSELQSRQYLVCRLLLEKKKKNKQLISHSYKTPSHTLTSNILISTTLILLPLIVTLHFSIFTSTCSTVLTSPSSATLSI